MQARLRQAYTPLQAFCIMLFCLLTIPCMATVAIVRRETNSWKLTFFQMGLYTVVAYVMTFIAFRIGLLFGIGTTFLS